jgi:hypothetical protein
MQVGHPEFLGNLRKVGRQRLAHCLTVGSVVHDAANTLFSREPNIVLEQLPGYIDLGCQLEHPHLQIVLLQTLYLMFRIELILRSL